ncbi:helix-turn-helix domain-containing protein [Kutzneria chonburiensis]|uniref:Helix-turn-helix domain-containing protein n=1 Tax=Kutzneria chonburiensis TaxID=1483604 RepID=A0ABV6N8U1_9PSEU|nr:helix-turn-helix domain-containing protein [Kutzneria chonburiensis]
MEAGRGVVEAAFAVLDQVRVQEPARLLDLAAATGIPRPTVHRLLGQLLAVGAVRRDGRKYWLGASLLTGGGQLERQVRAAATRPLAELAARTGAGVTLGLNIGGRSVYLQMIDAHEPLGVTAQPGEPVESGTAQLEALTAGDFRPYIDAGRVVRGLTCVAMPIPLPGTGTAAITAMARSPHPSPTLLNATRQTAARVADRLGALEVR